MGLQPVVPCNATTMILQVQVGSCSERHLLVGCVSIVMQSKAPWLIIRGLDVVILSRLHRGSRSILMHTVLRALGFRLHILYLGTHVDL